DPVGRDDQDAMQAPSVSLDRCAFVNVEGAAVGAARLALLGNVEEHARVPRPERRPGERAVQRQLLLGDFHFPRLVGAHLPLAFTGVSHARRFLSLPVTTSKNAFWMASVIGPALPSPICRPSSSRIGVTSAAVPVKNASSAMYTSSRVRRFARTS